VQSCHTLGRQCASPHRHIAQRTVGKALCVLGAGIGVTECRTTTLATTGMDKSLRSVQYLGGDRHWVSDRICLGEEQCQKTTSRARKKYNTPGSWCQQACDRASAWGTSSASWPFSQTSQLPVPSTTNDTGTTVLCEFATQPEQENTKNIGLKNTERSHTGRPPTSWRSFSCGGQRLHKGM